MADRRPEVLVVEDDAPIRELIREVLVVEEGCRVHAAENGKAALEVLRFARPDLIVLDLWMPEMDGWEFRQRQRAMPGLRDIPLLVVTASGALGPPVEQLGVAEVLRKPFDVAEFQAAVRRLLGR